MNNSKRVESAKAFIARRAFVWDPFKFWCPSVRPRPRPLFLWFSARRKALKTRFLDQSVQAKTSNTENLKIQNDLSEVGIDTYFRCFYETILKTSRAMYRWIFGIWPNWVHIYSAKSKQIHIFNIRTLQPRQIDARIRTNLNGPHKNPEGHPCPVGVI